MKILCRLFFLILSVSIVLHSSVYGAISFSVDTKQNPVILKADIPEGYHLYWKYPGDSGVGINVDLSSSKNVSDSSIIWPWPDVLLEENNISYIFRNNSVQIPILISATDSSKPVNLNLNIRGSICSSKGCEIYSQNIVEAFNLSDQNYVKQNDFSIVDSKIEGQDLVVSLQFKDTLDFLPKFIVTSPKSRFVKDIKVEERSDGLYVIRCLLDKDSYSTVAGLSAEIYSDASDFVHELSLPLISSPLAVNHSDYSFYLIVIFSLLGGLILNFMPCVLPILSLKLMSLLKGNKNVKHSTIMYLLGVFFTFNTIALCSILFKSFGQHFGFGMQFQNSQFVIVLAIAIVILISLSIDRLQLQFPNFVANKLTALNISNEYLLDFTNGIIASILSTSCAAPILGIAIGVALTGSSLINICIFNLIALGFSLPYLLIYVYPDLLSFVPKSGPWLYRIKQVISTLLILTLTWLIYILYSQLELRAVVGLFGLLILIKVVIESEHKILLKPFVRLGMFLLLSLACLYLPKHAAEEDYIYETYKENLWQRFSQQHLDQFIKDGNVVFVDITADWCATCKYNKILVLDRSWTIKMLHENKVVNLRGSLNTPNPEISKYLAKYNEYAIPFNIVYGPRRPEGIILPVNYSYNDLKEAILQAKQ
jgi:suppressor for copper-sensitivity B